MKERTKDEQIGDVYLEAAGWRPLLQDKPDGLWASHLGTMRRKEAIERQILAHSAGFVYWTSHAPENAREMASLYIFGEVLRQLSAMFADPDFKSLVVASLTKPDMREALNGVSEALRPIVRAWIADDIDEALAKERKTPRVVN